MRRFEINIDDEGKAPVYHIYVSHYSVKHNEDTNIPAMPLITPQCVDMAELDYHISELISNLEHLRAKANVKVWRDIGGKTYDRRETE